MHHNFFDWRTSLTCVEVGDFGSVQGGDSSASPLTVEEMIANPSQLATERALWLGQACLISNTNNVELAGRSPIRDVLSGRALGEISLGFYDDFIGKFHGSYKEFTEALRNAAEQNPLLYATVPDLFGPLFDDDEKKRLRADIRYGSLGEAYNCYLAQCSDAEKIDLSNDKIEYAAENVFSIAVSILAHANIVPNAEKKELFRRFLVDPWFDSPLAFIGGPDYHKPHKRIDAQVAIDSAKQLIDEGVIDPMELITSLDQEISKGYGMAFDAKLALTFAGALPGDTDSPSHLLDMQRTYIQRKLEQVEADPFQYELPVDQIASFVTAGLFPEEEARNTIESFDQRTGLHYKGEFDQRILCHTQRIPFNYDEHHVRSNSNASIIKTMAWYNAHEPGDDGDDSKEEWRNKNVSEYTESEQASVRNVIENYYSSHSLRLLAIDDLELYQDIFEDDLDRLRVIFRTSVERENQFDFPFERWEEIANFIGFSADEMRPHALRILSASDDIGAYCYLIRSSFDAEHPLFDKEDCIRMLVDKISMKNLDTRTASSIRKVAHTVFGRVLTEKYLLPLFHAKAELEVAFEGMDEAKAKAMSTETDMYDLVRNISFFNKLKAHLSPEEWKNLVDTTVAVSTGFEASKLLSIGWYRMSDTQRQTVIDSILRNPALASEQFGEQWLQFIRENQYSDHPLAIAEKPSIDLLEQYAPKSFKAYRRRLQANDAAVITAQNTYLQPFLYAPGTMDEYSAAAQAKQKLIAHTRRQRKLIRKDIVNPEETKRLYIHRKYAYHYDLCIRLENFLGQSTVPAAIRGKNDEKNELRALELLTLIHEAGKVPKLGAIEGMDKTQLEQLALYSVIGRAISSEKEKATVQAYLARNDVDVVKFSMWLHNAFRSTKLQAYLTPFVQHIAQGGDVVSWKKTGGNNLTGLPEMTLDSWLADKSETLQYGLGGTATIRFTNDLTAIYLSGTKPIETCLHYGYGLNRQALPGQLDADTKVVAIENANGNSIGKAVIKLAESNGKPTVIATPLYTPDPGKYDNDELTRAFVAATEQYARSLGFDFGVVVSQKHGQKTNEAAKLFFSATTPPVVSYATLQAPNAPHTYLEGYGVRRGAAQVPILQRSQR